MLRKSKFYNYILCIPKTIYFNFKYLPFKSAIKFPIIISHRTRLESCKGELYLPKNPKLGKIRIGFGSVQTNDSLSSKAIWNIGKHGQVHFGHRVKIGSGCRIHVSGKLTLADNVNFSGECTLVCHKNISIGSNCLIAWETVIMDTDFHPIYNSKTERTNDDKAINIADKVWIGARSTLVKGCNINTNSIIAAGAVVSGTHEGNSVIAGNPATIIGSMHEKYFTE